MPNNDEDDGDDILQRWSRERDDLKRLLVLQNTEGWQDLEGLSRVGGVDLSFVKGTDDACAGLVVCSYPDLEVVYEKFKMVRLTAPYVPGFLAFREAGPLLDLIQEQREDRPDLTPDVVMVDGNGILHNYGFGLACHLGVLADLPSIGVAKNLYQMNDEGLLRDQEHHRQIAALKEPGEKFDLLVGGGRVAGAALRSSREATKPVFVSVGHRISLDCALRLVLGCSRHRVPEPTRQADIRSREYIRNNSGSG